MTEFHPLFYAVVKVVSADIKRLPTTRIKNVTFQPSAQPNIGYEYGLKLGTEQNYTYEYVNQQKKLVTSRTTTITTTTTKAKEKKDTHHPLA